MSLEAAFILRVAMRAVSGSGSVRCAYWFECLLHLYSLLPVAGQTIDKSCWSSYSTWRLDFLISRSICILFTVAAASIAVCRWSINAAELEGCLTRVLGHDFFLWFFMQMLLGMCSPLSPSTLLPLNRRSVMRVLFFKKKILHLLFLRVLYVTVLGPNSTSMLYLQIPYIKNSVSSLWTKFCCVSFVFFSRD